MTDWQSIVTAHGGLVWRTAYRLLGLVPCLLRQAWFLQLTSVAQKVRIRA